MKSKSEPAIVSIKRLLDVLSSYNISTIENVQIWFLVNSSQGWKENSVTLIRLIYIL